MVKRYPAAPLHWLATHLSSAQHTVAECVHGVGEARKRAMQMQLQPSDPIRRVVISMDLIISLPDDARGRGDWRQAGTGS